MTAQRIARRLEQLEAQMAVMTASPLMLAASRGALPVVLRLQLRTVAEACCVAWEISLPDFLGPARDKHLVRARWAATLIARTGTTDSLKTLGRAWRRDHSTLLHGFHQAVRLLNEGDEDFAARLQQARALISSTTTKGTTT